MKQTDRTIAIWVAATALATGIWYEGFLIVGYVLARLSGHR